VHGVLGFECIVLRGAARDMGPWSNPIGCDARGQSRDAQNVTAMTPALSANWTSPVSEPARIFLHDPGSMHCDLFSTIPNSLILGLLLLAKGARGKD